MTLVNLTTFAILVIAMRTGNGKKLLPYFDPTDPVSLILSNNETGEDLRSAMVDSTNPTPWETVLGFGKNENGAYRLWPKDKV